MSDSHEPLIGGDEEAAWSRDVHERALQRKGAAGSCEACGWATWGVSGRLLLVEALDPSGRYTPGKGIEVIPVYCRHCGFLRLHAANVLLRD
jgi:hypothetical protein